MRKIKDSRSRIVIVDAYAEVVKGVICEAYKMDMKVSDGYVWFLPSLLTWDWYDTSYKNPYNLTCTKEQMKEGKYASTPLPVSSLSFARMV